MENGRSNSVAVVATVAASTVLVVSALLWWRMIRDSNAVPGGRAVSDLLQDCYDKMEQLEEDLAGISARV